MNEIVKEFLILILIVDIYMFCTSEINKNLIISIFIINISIIISCFVIDKITIYYNGNENSAIKTVSLGYSIILLIIAYIKHVFDNKK